MPVNAVIGSILMLFQQDKTRQDTPRLWVGDIGVDGTDGVMNFAHCYQPVIGDWRAMEPESEASRRGNLP